MFSSASHVGANKEEGKGEIAIQGTKLGQNKVVILKAVTQHLHITAVAMNQSVQEFSLVISICDF